MFENEPQTLNPRQSLSWAGRIRSFLKSNPRTMHLLLTTLLFIGLGMLSQRLQPGVNLDTIYVALAGLCIVLGIFHAWAAHRFEKPKETSRWRRRGWFTVAVTALAVFCFFFARRTTAMSGLWKMLTNRESSQSALVLSAAVALLLPFAYVVYWAFERWLAIPDRRYKLWYYPKGEEIPRPESFEPYHVVFRIARSAEREKDMILENAKASMDSVFGDYFAYFLLKYGQRNPDNPIVPFAEAHDQASFGWVFFLDKTWYRWWRRYLDPTLTLAQNGLSANQLINARRVIKYDAGKTTTSKELKS